MGQFMLDIQKFMQKADANQREVLQKIAFDMFTRIVMMSPVDTGRFRANWYPQIGSISVTSNWGAMDPTGTVSLARVKSASEQFGPGKAIYMSNNLPYANRLEYGWSRQAPAGMVRLNVANFQVFVDAAAAGVSK
jgi:hypothetical protein